jgi:hypothetical protein
MQNEPANTAIGSMGRSSHSTAHTATSVSSHHMTGMYGFQGSVSTWVP